MGHAGTAIAVLAALVAAIAAALLIAGTGGSGFTATPPIGESGGRPALRIPDGALRLDAQARRPIEDPDARWVRSAGRRLTPLLGRCEEGAPATIAARQVALVEATLWKAERVTIYRDAAAARAAMARLRRCRDHANRDGTATDWTIEPLGDIGEEALFVASLRTRDGEPLPGAHRGVVARQGRAIVWLVDFGPGSRRIAELADVPRYPSYAQASAQRLATAAWLRSPSRAR
jgi:hypothetical protein